MAPRKNVPEVHIFSTRGGDVVVRPDVNCYLLLPSLPTSPCAELWPLHPSLRGGEHYFSSRWHNSVYVIRDNTFLEAQDLSTSADVKRLHPSCCGGHHYFIVGGCFVIILSPGTMTAVTDLTTGEPDTSLDLGHHQWCKEKMESRQSYLYWQLWDNFTESFFTFNPNILNFLPEGLSLTKGTAFGAWELLNTFHNYSEMPVSSTHRVFQKVGCAKEKLADVGIGWTASLPDSLELSSIAVALTKAQFALPTEYGGMGVNTEQEEWEDIYEEEKILELLLQPNDIAYVWQYQLGLGKNAILFCREVKVTHSSDLPLEIPLPSSC
ncbi:uncharacterized protein LOC128330686 [Hemicordylus capensis]|uniref:uncharacterized protein LOC128330686 n=1 Tax=Hemicordylus capensis TaxID=884348 RepID=UPI002304903C|nr:uncharacterized protein LOC128330686 [Hemicordylus capensis]